MVNASDSALGWGVVVINLEAKEINEVFISKKNRLQ
jgi:hypothetical protein